MQKKKIVRVGALFQRFLLNKNYDSVPKGQYRLASFLMAIKDINESPDILPNTTILISVKDSKGDPGTVIFKTIELSNEAFNKTGVDVIIGPSSSGEAIASAVVAKAFQKVQVSYSATSPDLSSKATYNYFARVAPSDAFQGIAMAEYVYKHGWSNVITIASTDTYGASGIKQFQVSATSKGIRILAALNFPPNSFDFSSIISSAIPFDGRIFIFFMGQADAGYLLDQGTKAGLFHVGCQIIGSDSMTVSSVWKNMKNTTSDVMKGYIGFVPATSYNTVEAAAFLKKYLSLPNTELPGNQCSNATDDDGTYLHKGSNIY